jgi:TRAP-type uncharacterized transport system substrate-binding protein
MEHMLHPWRNIIRLSVLALSVGLLVFLVWRALPPRSVTIEAGPVGGSYYQIAAKYREALRSKGIDLIIESNPDSLHIIDDVERGDGGVDIGFTAQALDHKQFMRTRTVGAVQLQPLFLFVQKRLGPIASLSQIQGLRVVMPPIGSATSQAALAVLRLFGVAPTNTPIQFHPLADAVSELRKNEADAGLFMLDPSNALVIDMLTDPNLRLIDLHEARAISRQLPFLQMVTLPRASLAVDTHVPPDDTTLLAASVNIVVRQDLHPAVLYTLLEAMKEVHHGATPVSDLGAFPTLESTELLPHSLAREFYRSGMPWIYRNLPLPIASLIDRYFVVGIVLLLLTETYKNLKYFRELAKLVMEHCCVHALSTIGQSQRVGRLWPLVARLAELVLASSNKRQRSR